MKYANPSKCPQCDAQLSLSLAECQSCGFYLESNAAKNLWKTLQSADHWLALAKEESKDRREPSIALNSETSLSASSVVPPPPLPNFPAQPSKQVAVKKPLDTGAILLMLGALFILVAGSILSALALGIFALPLMTLIAAGLTFFVDSKKLKASTEAMISITAILGGLTLGLFLWGSSVQVFIWASILLVTAVIFVESTKDHRDYHSPKWIAGLSVIPLSLSAGNITHDLFPSTIDFFYGFVALLVTVALTALFYRLKLKVAFYISGVTSSIWAVFSLVTAIGNLVWHPTFKELFLNGHAAPIIITSAILLIGAFILKNKSVQIALMAIGVVQLFFLFWLPIESEKIATVFALLFALTSVFASSRKWWQCAVRYAGIVGFSIGGLFYVGLWVPVLVNAIDDIMTAGYLGWNESILGLNNDWWLLLLAGTTVSAYIFLIMRWHELTALRKHERIIISSIILLHVPLLVAFLAPTPFLLPFSFLITAALIAFVNRRLTKVSLILFTLPPLMLFENLAIASAIFLTAALLTLSLTFLLKAQGLRREVSLALAGAYSIVSLASASIHFDWSAAIQSLSIAMALCLILVASYGLRNLSNVKDRGLEVSAIAIGGPLSIAFAAESSIAWLALLLVIVGATFIVISFFDKNRSIYRYAGSGLLGLAWILRLIASNVSTPEAYSAPFAVALLAFGSYALYSNKALSSVKTLTPGVTLALAPSIPWIMADPVSLRALLVSLIAIMFLAVGAQLRLKAPFVFAATALSFIAFIELGPYAFMMSRWILIGIAGVLFAIVGATWESRVKDGKAVANYISSMR